MEYKTKRILIREDNTDIKEIIDPIEEAIAIDKETQTIYKQELDLIKELLGEETITEGNKKQEKPPCPKCKKRRYSTIIQNYYSKDRTKQIQKLHCTWCEANIYIYAEQ